MNKLSCLLLAHDIEFDPVNCKIPYFLHIINLCTQHILSGYHSVDLATVPAQWQACDTVIKKESYSEALKLAPVKWGKNLVHVICASGQ